MVYRQSFVEASAVTSLMILCSAAFSVESLSSATVPRNRVIPSPSLSVDDISVLSSPSVKYLAFETENALDDDDKDEVSKWEGMESAVGSYHRLLRSTGSDVLQSELQEQINLGPRAFLNQHGSSELEKVAMSSVIEQLPQAAVVALRYQQEQQRAKELPEQSKNGRTYKGDLNFSTSARITPEQEQQLARIIQIGVALQKVKQELESKISSKQPISSHQWAMAVQLSTRELRQTISAYRKAKQDLVTANMGLVHAVVNQHCGAAKAAGISKEELIQEGALGLLRAAELFDPSRGLRFSTYAVVWIKGVLSNSHIPELVRVPARERTKWNKIVRAQKDLIRLSGDASAISTDQLASAAGLSVSEVLETQTRMNQASNVLSLDFEHKMHSRSGTESGTMESTLTSDKNMRADEADLVGRTQMQADVIAAMARNLDAREARLMRLRYGLSDGVSRSLQECADSMGLSYSRVHQLSQKCLQKLREAAEAESLEEYLLTVA